MNKMKTFYQRSQWSSLNRLLTGKSSKSEMVFALVFVVFVALLTVLFNLILAIDWEVHTIGR